MSTGSWQPDPYVNVHADAQSGYRSLGGRTRIVLASFALWGVTGALLIVANVIRLGLIAEIRGGTLPSLQDLTFSDNLVRTAAWSELGAFLLTGITFLVWFHRVVANNRESAYELSFSPRLAVGCWFIPFANLVMPLQAVREAWRTAASPPKSYRASRIAIRMPLYITAWWLLWVAGNLATVVAQVSGSGSSSAADPLGALQSQATILIVALALHMVAAVLAVTLILGLKGRQELRHAAIERSLPAPPPSLPPPPAALADAATGVAHLDVAGGGSAFS